MSTTVANKVGELILVTVFNSMCMGAIIAFLHMAFDWYKKFGWDVLFVGGTVFAAILIFLVDTAFWFIFLG